MGRSIPQSMRPPSPPILGISDTHMVQNSALSNGNPQIIYKPNNQEVVYKQNIMVRWLQPPTPPPPAPIIIRGALQVTQRTLSPTFLCRNPRSRRNATANRVPTNASVSTNTAAHHCSVKIFLLRRIPAMQSCVVEKNHLRVLRLGNR